MIGSAISAAGSPQRPKVRRTGASSEDRLVSVESRGAREFAHPLWLVGRGEVIPYTEDVDGGTTP